MWVVIVAVLLVWLGVKNYKRLIKKKK